MAARRQRIRVKNLGALGFAVLLAILLSPAVIGASALTADAVLGTPQPGQAWVVDLDVQNDGGAKTIGEFSAWTDWGPHPDMEHRQVADGNPNGVLRPGERVTVRFTFQVPRGSAGGSFMMHFMALGTWGAPGLETPSLREVRALPFHVSGATMGQILELLSAPVVLLVGASIATLYASARLLRRRLSVKTDQPPSGRVTEGAPRTGYDVHRPYRFRR